jgi:hypothetical protein
MSEIKSEAKFEVNYELIDPKFKSTVRSIESKPHVRYIRYLFTKRYSPTVIKKELYRLGLSAPHEPQLTAYYLCLIDPLIKAFGISELYSDYKNKLLRSNSRGDFAKDILIYRLHIDNNLDMQVKFCKFIRYIETGDLWLNEIYNYHGNATRLPVDENGERILDSSTTFKVVDKILLHPKRYLIDKMILENVPDIRIAEYFKTKLGDTKINRYDVACYKRSFFNIKTQSIEERIQSLEAEKGSLEQLLKDIDILDDYVDMDLGERLLVKRQSETRIEELNDNIKTLNSMYSEFAFQAATGDRNDFLSMFSDVVTRGYARFCQLDVYKDRDVVDPLVKTAKMMAFAHDKVEMIKSSDTNKNNGITDTHSQGVIMELYKKRMEEIAEEQIKRSNEELSEMGIDGLNPEIDPDEIAGIDELGSNIIAKDETDK